MIVFLRQKFKIAFIFLKRNFFLLLIGFFLGGIIFFFRQPLISLSQIFSPSRARIGILGKYRIDNLPEEIKHLVSFGLTKLSANNSPQAGAALSWEIKEEGKQYIFHLDPLLHWQDGSPFKSNDFNSQIEGGEITFPDPYTIVINLEKPLASLPALLAEPILKKNLAGLGDYRIKKIYSNAGYITLLGIKAVREGIKPKEISLRFYPNQESLVTAFKLGEIDCLEGLSSLEELRNWENLIIVPQKESNSRYVALFFNTSKEPFSDKRFRQALAYSFTKPQENIRAFTPISPLSWAYNQNVKTYPFDLERGKKILEELGLEQASIQIATTFDLSDWGEKIKEEWEKNLGLQTDLRILSFISPQEDFDVILGYGLIPADPDQYPFWRSGEAGNITRFSNPRIDKLLEDGRTILNKDERKNVYHDFQRFLLEEVPAIFLFHPTTYQICRPNASGLN